nr:ATP-binding protein [Streptomyces boncukensis]
MRNALSVWDLGELEDPGVILASELVTNSVRHARCRMVRVTVTRLSRNTVRVAVVDKCHARLVVRDPGDTDTSGRGLVIVDAMTDRWGTEPLPWGKRVWGELSLKG